MAVSKASLGRGSTLGWVVGIFEWLDSEESKVRRYWRTIEEGSEATRWPWVGQRLVGLWGEQAGPPGRLINGSPLTAAGRGEDQKFVPFSNPLLGASDAELLVAAKRAFRYFLSNGSPDGPNFNLLYGDTPSAKRAVYFHILKAQDLAHIPFVTARVQRPIEAAHHYRAALAEYDPMEREITEMKKVMKGSLGGKDPGSAAGLRNMRADVAAQVQGKGRDQVKSGRRRSEGAPTPGVNIFEGITIGVASAVLQDNIRTKGGSFSTLQTEIRRVNALVAAGYQDAVVSQMNDNRSRPATGALRAATASPQNRYPRDLG